jgi:hypothetical protein
MCILRVDSGRMCQTACINQSSDFESSNEIVMGPIRKGWEGMLVWEETEGEP